MARPLDKIVKGAPLKRNPVIEATIDAALRQDLGTLVARAAVSDPNSPDYLPSECLVHLIRNALRQSNGPPTHNTVAHSLLPFLLKRCEANLATKVSNTIPNAKELREEITSNFAVMFANDLTPEGCPQLDFYEVKFNRVFRLRRIDAVRAALKHINRIAAGPKKDELDEPDTSLEDIAENVAAPDTDPVEGIFRQQMRPRLLAALKALPENERKAFILRYHFDYDIESEDLDVITVATLMKVSGRTIHNWLKRARAKLAEALKEAK
jgi:RNA polymerase sigma factor (sigma-70 family)